MDMRARRVRWSAALAAAFLLLSGWLAAPAGAVGVDPELVVESVSEDGYYVDSGAPYFQSDADLDRLRASLDGKRRAGVVVLPAGADAGSILNRLLRTPNRQSTYVVLVGRRLMAGSNSVSSATVDRMLARARRASDPETAVLNFFDELNPKAGRKAPMQKGGNLPLPSGSEAPSGDPTAPVAAGKSDDGGNGLLYGAGGLIAVAAAAGGYLLWRRRRTAGGN
jgi:hypothetical protein